MEDRSPPPIEAPPSRGVAGRIDQALSTMWNEQLMRPLLLVILGHAAAFLVPILLLGLRDANLPALAVLAILIVATGSGLVSDWQAGRLRVLSGFVLCTWLLGSIGAGLGYYSGYF